MPKGHYQRTPGVSAHGVAYHIAKRRGMVRAEYPNKTGTPSHKNPVTHKQKAAVEQFLAHPEKTHKDNVKAAGYGVPESHAAVVVGSKGFQEYLNERVPDEKLARLVNEGLAAEKPPAGFEDFVPDWNNRFKFVELVAKLKGYNVAVAPTVTVQFTNNLPRPEARDVDHIPEADIS